MKTNDLLANVKIASPCPARWDQMNGDDHARFCAQCQNHVYDLSALTAEQAAALIRAKEGALCARFYQRADGTVLTADCPVGAAQVLTRVRRLVGAAVALLILSLGVPLLARPSDNDQLPRARAKIFLAWDDTLSTVRGWLGFRPRRMLMGAICVRPPATNAPVTPTPQPSTAN